MTYSCSFTPGQSADSREHAPIIIPRPPSGSESALFPPSIKSRVFDTALQSLLATPPPSPNPKKRNHNGFFTNLNVIHGDEILSQPAEDGSLLKDDETVLKKPRFQKIDVLKGHFQAASKTRFSPPHQQQKQRTLLQPNFPVTKDNAGRPRQPHNHFIPLENIRNPFLKEAVLLQQTLPLTCKLKDGSKIQLSVDIASMTGQHCVIASIAPDQPQTVAGVPNDQVLFKTFRDYCILARDDQKIKITMDAPDNVLEQYDQMIDHHIPVMQIYNYDNAKMGCGYFLVEKVPHPFHISWDNGAKISELSPDQLQLLDEVRHLFESTYNAHIHADLQPNNLRRRDDGVLVFIDLREDKPNADEYEREVKIDFKKMLGLFNCKPDDEIYLHLSANLDLETPWPAK